MATLLELTSLLEDETLLNRVRGALVVAAAGIISEASPTAARIAFAKTVLSDPSLFARQALTAIIGINSAAATTAIRSATDSAIQSNVTTAVNKVLAV